MSPEVTGRQRTDRACHDAARRTGGSVTAARQPGVTPSFHTVVISYDDEQIAVLRHDRLDVITLAQEPAHGSTVITAFIDRPALAEILCQTTNCSILSAAEHQDGIRRLPARLPS